jgi:hypothetical protein
MQEQYIHIDKNSNKFYYKDREMTIFHRFNGPAVEHADGYKEWWVNGKRLSEGAFDTLTKPIELTLEDIAAKYGVDVSKVKIKK